MTALTAVDAAEVAAAFAGFAACLVVGRRATAELRWTLGALFLVSLYHGVSNVAEWGGITAALDVWEDYLDVVRPVLWGGVFFLLARETTDCELRRATADLERQNHELRKLDRIKDGLIRDVTHELKTPVAKQSMQLEILRTQLARGGAPGAIERTLQAIEAGIRRQEGVIRNILELAYLESGRRERRFEAVRLDRVLEEVLEDYREMLAACNVEARLLAEPCTIASDAEMLWHVFSNLVNNSIKYRRRDGSGKIEISLFQRDGRAIVRVADDGIGLTAEEQQRAFERFFQGSAASEGVGVGLAICRLVLSHLDGSVRLESPGPGAGATAIVELPACVGSAAGGPGP